MKTRNGQIDLSIVNIVKKGDYWSKNKVLKKDNEKDKV